MPGSPGERVRPWGEEKGKKKLKDQKKKDIARHRGSKAIRAKAVSFASSPLFADQIHCLSRPKLTTPKSASCSLGRCFLYWKQIYFDTPDAVLPQLPSVRLRLSFPICTTPCSWFKPGARCCWHQSGLTLTRTEVTPRFPATRSQSYPSLCPWGKSGPTQNLFGSPVLDCAQGRVLVSNSSQQCLLKCPFPAAPQDSKSHENLNFP